jgi:hypothetical protein
MNKTKTIYIELLEEGVRCWRPVRAEHASGELYRILEERPEDETWPFAVGETVRCREQTFQDGSRGLLAYEKSSKSMV